MPPVLRSRHELVPWPELPWSVVVAAQSRPSWARWWTVAEQGFCLPQHPSNQLINDGMSIPFLIAPYGRELRDIHSTHLLPIHLTTKMLASRFRVASQLRRSAMTRGVTTLSNNPDIVGSVDSSCLTFSPLH